MARLWLSGFSLLLFFFFPPPLSSFLVGPAGRVEGGSEAGGGEVRCWVCFCRSKVGGEPCPQPGTGLILPTGERRESPEVPGFSFAPLKVIHVYGSLRRFSHCGAGFGGPKYLGEFSYLWKGELGWFSAFVPLPRGGFEARESPWVVAGRWFVEVSWGCSPLFAPRHLPGCVWGGPSSSAGAVLGLSSALHRGSRNDPAVASVSPATSRSGNLKFPVPSSLISSSSGAAVGVTWGGGGAPRKPGLGWGGGGPSCPGRDALRASSPRRDELCASGRGEEKGGK